MSRPKGLNQPKGMTVTCPACGASSHVTQRYPQTRTFVRFHAHCQQCGVEFAGGLEVTHWLKRQVEEIPIEHTVLALGVIRQRRRKTDWPNQAELNLDTLEST